MKTTAVTLRLAGLGGAKWEIHKKAKELINQGRDIVNLTIGEPDVPTPDRLMEVATQSMRRGRTGYSDGRREEGRRFAIAERASARTGQSISDQQVMCFPGTQTALFAVLMGVAEIGDDVLVGDPMYATYEGVVLASGANMVSVPLRADNGFRVNAGDIAKAITPRTTALLLTTPHNPTGAILRESDIREIGELARQHDLWIISDEVYEDFVFSVWSANSAIMIRTLSLFRHHGRLNGFLQHSFVIGRNHALWCRALRVLYQKVVLCLSNEVGRSNGRCFRSRNSCRIHFEIICIIMRHTRFLLKP